MYIYEQKWIIFAFKFKTRAFQTSLVNKHMHTLEFASKVLTFIVT
jgi:hypothetical protein